METKTTIKLPTRQNNHHQSKVFVYSTIKTFLCLAPWSLINTYIYSEESSNCSSILPVPAQAGGGRAATGTTGGRPTTGTMKKRQESNVASPSPWVVVWEWSTVVFVLCCARWGRNPFSQLHMRCSQMLALLQRGQFQHFSRQPEAPSHPLSLTQEARRVPAAASLPKP